MTEKWKNKRVGVLMGGKTKERDISLKTGRALLRALKSKDYNVVEIDVGEDLIQRLQNIDVAVIALHGKWGEDGCIQGLLEIEQIPYTGTGVLGSSVCMNKMMASFVARSIGVSTPEEAFFSAEKESVDLFLERISIEPPLIVKPSREGSSINITIIRDKAELGNAIDTAAKSDGQIVVQKYIKGREITVGVLNGVILPLLEIAPTNKFYDFEAKYTKGKSEYIIPARISEDCAVRIVDQCSRLAKLLELKGAARIDYIVTDDNHEYFLEINTIPGMTELSLVPMAANNIGIDFPELAERILNGAGLQG
ncbi:MAG: D-alanine--D-alanine ligase [Pseudomonadota bacterium]